MWSVVAGPFWAAAMLLVAAGVPKLKDPLPLVRALRSVSLPANRLAVRLIAAGEVLVGIFALVAPGRASATLLALAYIAFTGFVLLALRRGGVLGSCGCFGRPDTAPSRTHVLLTGALAAAAAALGFAPPPESVWAQGPSAPQIVLVGYALLLAALSYVVIAILPTATAGAARASAPRS